jgi:hypothetical protein
MRFGVELVKQKASNEGTHRLWLFFVAYWDDHVTNPGPGEEGARITARTARVVRDLSGPKAFAKMCELWARDGDIRVLGDLDTLPPDEPCIQVLGYVKEHDPWRKPRK